MAKEDQSKVTKDEAGLIMRYRRRQDVNTSPRLTFHPFPRLAVELQCLIWKEAAENCFVTFATYRNNIRRVGDPPPKHGRRTLPTIRDDRELCNRR